MSHSMIERVARMICANQGGDPDAITYGEGAAWGKSWTGWQAYANEAREIIAAMREPTDDMVDAGEATADRPCLCMSARYAWRAMIDEALAEDAK